MKGKKLTGRCRCHCRPSSWDSILEGWAGYPICCLEAAEVVLHNSLARNKDKLSIKQRQEDKEFFVGDQIFSEEAKKFFIMRYNI